MGHSYTSCHIHYIFSTKYRLPQITSDTEERLWAYIGGIARENGMCAVSIGGRPDHAHVLTQLPSTMSMAKGVQLLKSGSSKWIHDTFPALQDFAWQEGYGAFSLSTSSLPGAVEYIVQQEIHHRKHTFKEELIAFFERYGIEYDEQHLWD
ncbi:MAG: IS200/IS605 family transposase [Armatimonadota bacterium]